ncbi:nucleotidyltransferase family protein [Pseudorhodobacter turbinis]|uniref:Nucleotidyltransferase family protein n=1 Tax=Pseudorhodobacter turbinis TaxID=2500533 RepID=A0A4P8EG63_9RHOB|nr:nucleotidyltransferase family protein [Pseudorhodobacter turbinis]QCO55866.1 nucleotidyltransferase family protein [Pseudorhodobacter turbinis]
MRNTADAVMLFAAGFGTRMGDLTADMPKPLIPVAGMSLLDHALQQVEGAGLRRVVVNTHYKAEQISKHLVSNENIAVSWEKDAILETGGGLRAALPLLGEGPVFTLNTDAVWTGPNPLITLQDHWDGAQMDALLLLAPPNRIKGYKGAGDFILTKDGRIVRTKGAAGLAYLGAQIILPRGIEAIPDQAFSLNILWDRMIDEGRAFGVVHTGGWCDVGRPEGIAIAEEMLNHVP